MVMKLQIFTIKKFLRWTSAIKKDEDYYSQVFLKECKYIEEEGVRHIINDLESSDDDSNDSDNSD